MARHIRDTEDHDLLFIPRQPRGAPRSLQRIGVDKRRWDRDSTIDNGEKNKGGHVVEVQPPSSPDDPGFRKAMSIAEPGGDQSRGPAFACMPIRPEPASSFYTCYLVDGNNVNFRNAWTKSGWNDQPGDDDTDAPEAWGPANFEVLIAGTRGRVYHLDVRNGKTANFEEVNLGLEGEIWIQLRSGVVAGRVQYYKHPSGSPKVLPLVNVTALQLPESQAPSSRV
jgi:hypothetical protein